MPRLCAPQPADGGGDNVRCQGVTSNEGNDSLRSPLVTSGLVLESWWRLGRERGLSGEYRASSEMLFVFTIRARDT